MIIEQWLCIFEMNHKCLSFMEKKVKVQNYNIIKKPEYISKIFHILKKPQICFEN